MNLSFQNQDWNGAGDDVGISRIPEGDTEKTFSRTV